MLSLLFYHGIVSTFQLVLLGLGLLPKTFRFNILAFGTSYRELFHHSEPINDKTLQQATSFIKVRGHSAQYSVHVCFVLICDTWSMFEQFFVSMLYIYSWHLSVSLKIAGKYTENFPKQCRVEFRWLTLYKYLHNWAGFFLTHHPKP